MNRKLSFISTAFLLLLFLCLSIPSFAKGPEKESTGQNFLYKTSALDPNRTLCNINNWSYWMYFDGNAGIDPDGNSGGVYPRGTAGAIYEDGLVWGAKVNGNIRVGGQTYRVGTRGVLSRIYRIRSDWKSLTADAVKEDAAEFNRVAIAAVTEAQTADIIEQYKKDWAEWPVDDGAPYVENTLDAEGKPAHNDVYDPVLDADGMPDPNAGDYPGIASADQVVFFVADDGDAGRVSNLYGSDAMGIEMQVTTWGYNQRAATLGQLIFKKYKIINISSDTFTDMYVAQWCDPDLGSSSDDLVGCDSLLSIGFAYNGGPSDSNFDPFGIPAPAVGYDFFQGPVVDGVAGQDVNGNGVDDADDYAVFDLKEVGPGKINLPMTSFAYFSAGNTEWDDPDLGEYNGSLQWYNLLRGNISNTFVDAPTSFQHRNTGTDTNFPLNGDPVAGTGDIDGHGSNFSPADRRMSVNTGPFTMAPGDVQEVVVAIVGGHGVDYLDSVTKIKTNDDLAQKLYSALFTTIPKAPPAPDVKFTVTENEVSLTWDGNADAVARTEETIFKDSETTGYAFEGYNVYQVTFGLKAQTKLLATYDIINGVKTINKTEYLANLGTNTVTPVRFGTDSGIKRYYVTDRDQILGGELQHGKNYFFAVTAYNYNPDPQLLTDLSLESSITPIPVQTQAKLPGYKTGSDVQDGVTVAHPTGVAEQSEVEVKVIRPADITGHEYKIEFEKGHFYLDVDGKWKHTAYPDSIGKFGKTNDASASTISGSALVSHTVGSIDLVFSLTLDAGSNWIDGIKIDLPAGISVNSWAALEGDYGTYLADGQNGVNRDGTYNATENSITWGDSARSAFGAIEGTVTMIINVQPGFTFPVAVDYEVYDDGYDGTIVDAGGTITLTELGYEFTTTGVWFLRDMTLGTTLIERSTAYNLETGILDLNSGVSKLGAPIVDGMQITVSGSFEAPINFSSVSLTSPSGLSTLRTAYDNSGDVDNIRITNYTVFGGTVSSYSADNFDGVGTYDLAQLVQDYELRFTGVLDTVDIQGVPVVITASGGSMATIFRGVDAAALGTHPLNPNPGTDEPFQVRIPFEVWNTVTGKQVNLTFRDRERAFPPSDTSVPWHVWNRTNRMYAIVVNSDYDETQPIQVDNGPDALNANATWVWVFCAINYHLGDVVKINYPNPIVPGTDTYTFSTTGLGQTFTVADEKDALGKTSVFPNPYYAGHDDETNKFNRFVTFYPIAPKTTVRIFNLAGDHVVKLETPAGNTSQFLQWDLLNDSDLPVASGIYFAHVKMTLSDGSTKTKVLKFFIIQKRQQLKFF